MIDIRDFGRLAFGLCCSVTLLAPAHAEEAASARPKPACNRADFRVILDVGHTIDSPGAYSARGATEYGFNFFLTRQIEHQLRKAGFAKTVVMITPGKARPSLAMRIAHANRLGGQLLLSIHHDSVPQQFKRDWEYEGREFEYSDRFHGHSIFVSRDSHDLRGSMLFGKLLGQELKARGMTYTPHYTERFMGRRQRPLLDALSGVYSYDKLLVLRQTHMPAVLLEAGNIVNREEELELLSEERQVKTSTAVVQAVDEFCAAKLAPAPQYIASRTSLRSVAKRLSHRRFAIKEASALKRR
jgi:N-acetylmuramoyl-L-alanine amidase